MTVKNYSIFLLLFYFTFTVTISAQVQESRINPYLPDLDGILKTKFEYDLNNSLMRFEVRNARFGARGKINELMSYRAEIDLSDEGKMKMLDAWVRFTPLQGLDFYMGQRKIPFSSDYMRSPADNIFANRSFIAKYINNGLRDIGFYAEYRFGEQTPVAILAGTVNGTGNNNPQWIRKPNIVNRISAGGEEGIRLVANMYHGEAQYRSRLAMYGAEVRFRTSRFHIESEYIRRNWTDTTSARVHDDGLYLHSYYNFVPSDKMVKMITPVARIDFMGTDIFRGSTEASRLTMGINFGFEPKQFQSEIRFNYENYFKSSLPVHTDKLTVEFIARF